MKKESGMIHDKIENKSIPSKKRPPITTFKIMIVLDGNTFLKSTDILSVSHSKEKSFRKVLILKAEGVLKEENIKELSNSGKSIPIVFK